VLANSQEQKFMYLTKWTISFLVNWGAMRVRRQLGEHGFSSCGTVYGRSISIPSLEASIKWADLVLEVVSSGISRRLAEL
jgi:hypothetical protein